MKKIIGWISWTIFCFFLAFAFCFFLESKVKPEEVITTIPMTEIKEAKPVEKDEIRAMIEKMTLEEKVGQLFLVRNPYPEMLDQVMNLKPGGLVLFGRDFKDKTAQQVKDDIAFYQSLSSYPLLIATDEEGGLVNRVSWNEQLVASPFPSPQQLYADNGFISVSEDAHIKSQILLDLGINFNLAPVADVSNDVNDYIYSRTIGLDAKSTAEYITHVIAAMNEEKIGSCLKHFPGYGNNLDTHQQIAVDKRSKETFYENDFLPFMAGIKANASAVLVSHNIVEAFDKKPASLSYEMHRILRDELKFEGVIITDDLMMQAIVQFMEGKDPCVEGIKAGNDMLIVNDFINGYTAVYNAVMNGELEVEKIEESVYRILKMKQQLGLIK